DLLFQDKSAAGVRRAGTSPSEVNDISCYCHEPIILNCLLIFDHASRTSVLSSISIETFLPDSLLSPGPLAGRHLAIHCPAGNQRDHVSSYLHERSRGMGGALQSWDERDRPQRLEFCEWNGL